MRTGLLLALGVSVGLVGVAQSAPKFEVVSIKPSNPGPGFSSMGAHFEPGGRFVGTNVTAASLLGLPFHEGDPPFPGVENPTGLPAWTRTQRFNVAARAGDELANEELANTSLGSALVRSMLEDRFKVRAHLEPRDRPAFGLKVAKANGSLGPKIHPSLDCEAVRRERVARGDTPFAPGPPAAGERRCGFLSMLLTKEDGPATHRVTATGVPLSMLALPALRVAVMVPVVDQTNLTGLYDFELTWADDNTGRGDTPTLPDGPSIFTALQEQLGLKLESTRVQRNVIVVDHIEPPTAD